VRGEPVAKFGEVDRATNDTRAQEFEDGDVDRERESQDPSVLDGDVHNDAPVLLAEGTRPAGECPEERRRLVRLVASNERSGVFERARQRGFVSSWGKPVSLSEEFVTCEEARQVREHQRGSGTALMRQSGCTPLSRAASQASPSSSPYRARPSSYAAPIAASIANISGVGSAKYSCDAGELGATAELGLGVGSSARTVAVDRLIERMVP
jgi:hypothetical protein